VFVLVFVGVDPVAKRSMWDVISRIVTTNKECALILTTHSMDECESLSNRYMLLSVLSVLSVLVLLSDTSSAFCRIADSCLLVAIEAARTL
jgi:ABC-type nitrate/sulfonate/bicarbonate transport system ATPase subunit